MSLMEPCTLPLLCFNVVNSGHRTHCTVTAVFSQHPVSLVCWSNSWSGFPVYTALMGEYSCKLSDPFGFIHIKIAKAKLFFVVYHQTMVATLNFQRTAIAIVSVNDVLVCKRLQIPKKQSSFALADVRLACMQVPIYPNMGGIFPVQDKYLRKLFKRDPNPLMFLIKSPVLVVDIIFTTLFIELIMSDFIFDSHHKVRKGQCNHEFISDSPFSHVTSNYTQKRIRIYL